MIPFHYNSRDATYYLDAPSALTFGGATGVLNGGKQRLRVELRGNSAAGLLVGKIAGTGASLGIDSVLS